MMDGDVPNRIDSVYGAVMHPRLHCWVFPAFRPCHTKVLEDLTKVCPWLRIDDKAKDHAQKQSLPEPLPEGFEFITQPFAHQRDGLQWLLDNRRGGLFFDPGLGKCKITIDLQRAAGCKMLILCPRVVLRTWKREFLTHGNIDDVLIVEGTPEEKEAIIAQAIARAPIALVTTYETAVRYSSSLNEVKYTCIVADESHRIKTPTSIRTKAAQLLSEKASRRILLSGTPSLGSPLSLYAQLRFLGKYFAPENWIEFKKKFAEFPAEELAQGKAQRIIGFKNLDILHDRAMGICLRRTKEECLDLPPQQIIDMPFDVSDEQRGAYNLLVEQGADLLGDSIKHAVLAGQLTQKDGAYLKEPYVLSMEPISLVNKLEQITGGFVNQTYANPGICAGCPSLLTCVREKTRPYTSRCSVVKKPKLRPYRYEDNARAAACEELLEGLLEEPENKVIIWTRYIEEISIVKDIVKRCGVDSVVVRGGMTTDDLETAMSRFNIDPKVRVYIGQVASGIGVTLNAANYGIYYSTPWSHEHYIQSLGRNYRIGQQRRVIMYRLLALHTLDMAKAKALDQKIEIEDLLIGNDRENLCEKHGLLREPQAPCTCNESVMRIVAKIRAIP